MREKLSGDVVVGSYLRRVERLHALGECHRLLRILPPKRISTALAWIESSPPALPHSSSRRVHTSHRFLDNALNPEDASSRHPQTPSQIAVFSVAAPDASPRARPQAESMSSAVSGVSTVASEVVGALSSSIPSNSSFLSYFPGREDSAAPSGSSGRDHVSPLPVTRPRSPPPRPPALGSLRTRVVLVFRGRPPFRS